MKRKIYLVAVMALSLAVLGCLVEETTLYFADGEFITGGSATQDAATKKVVIPANDAAADQEEILAMIGWRNLSAKKLDLLSFNFPDGQSLPEGSKLTLEIRDKNGLVTYAHRTFIFREGAGNNVISIWWFFDEAEVSAWLVFRQPGEYVIGDISAKKTNLLKR